MDIDFFNSQVYTIEGVTHFGANIVSFTPKIEKMFFTYLEPTIKEAEDSFIQTKLPHIPLKNSPVKKKKNMKPVNSKINQLIQEALAKVQG